MYNKEQGLVVTGYFQSSSSRAMGHWGTCPLDFQQYFFSSLRSHTKSI